jgi:hypothetical protein
MENMQVSLSILRLYGPQRGAPRTSLLWLPLALLLAIPAAASAQTDELVSVTSGGAELRGARGASLSETGRYVSFVRDYSGDAAGPTIFLRDRQTQTTRSIVLPAPGESGDPPDATTQGTSRDGRFTLVSMGVELCTQYFPGCPAFSPPGLFLVDWSSNTFTQITHGDQAVLEEAMSGDGRYVAFGAAPSNVRPQPVEYPVAVYLWDRVTGLRHIISPPDTQNRHVDVSADGRWVGFNRVFFNGTEVLCLFDRQSGATVSALAGDIEFSTTAVADGGRVVFQSYRRLAPGETDDWYDVFLRNPSPSSTQRISLSPSGAPLGESARFYSRQGLSRTGRYTLFGLQVDAPSRDRRVYLRDALESGSRFLGTLGRLAHLSDDGTTIAYETWAAGNAFDRIFVRSSGVGPDVRPVDTDSDGLPDEWETSFGLNPDSASGLNGAAGDPDGDGATNAQELAAGTHPRGSHKRYLAEGATGSFFDSRIALLNPGTTTAAVLLRFLPQDGQTVTLPVTLPPGARGTIDPESLAGLEFASFSTVVESDALLVVDRTMTWGGGYGSHAETALVSPSNTWYLAEGATGVDFQLFYLLQNPNPAPVTATVRYLLPDGLAPIQKSYPLQPNSRTTIHVNNEDPGLAATDVSAVVTGTQPIIVERAMYLNKPGQAFAAGHGSAGVTAPALEWFLAEGATGPFFDLFVLIANPNPTPAHVTADYLLLGGGVRTKSYTIPANSRFTIYVDQEEIPAGSGQRPLVAESLSTIVRSTNGVPVIVERSMWWPGPEVSANVWYEAHNSPGATTTGTKWALAEGEVGGPVGMQTFVLLANTSATAGSARVSLHFEDGTRTERTYTLPANSRTNVAVATDFPEAANKRFGTIIESLGATPTPIVVERAMYFGEGWTAGTNALATKLEP